MFSVARRRVWGCMHNHIKYRNQTGSGTSKYIGWYTADIDHKYTEDIYRTFIAHMYSGVIIIAYIHNRYIAGIHTWRVMECYGRSAMQSWGEGSLTTLTTPSAPALAICSLLNQHAP